MPGQEAFDARHDPLPRPPALHVDVAVPAFARTGVTDKAMTAPLQFLVQYVQHQVRQQRRERPALRRPLAGRPKPAHPPARPRSESHGSAAGCACRTPVLRPAPCSAHWMPTELSPWAERPAAQGRPRRNWGREVPPFIAATCFPDSPDLRREEIEMKRRDFITLLGGAPM